MSRKVGSSVAVVIGLSVFALLLASRQAAADHIAGATYTGNVRGGNLSLTVSADGSQLSFTAAGVDGIDPTNANAACTVPLTATISNIRINNNHAFDRTDRVDGGVEIRVQDGSFGIRSASGRLRMERVDGTCRMDPLNATWSATTTATGTATPTPTVTPLGDLSGGCLDFRSQAEAQAFFTLHRAGDPFGLDTDGDGQACEGLGAVAATATSRPSLPRTGSATPIYGFTGLSLVLTGIGLTVLARRRRSALATMTSLPRAVDFRVRLESTRTDDVPARFEADYVMSGWLPTQAQR